MTDEIVIVPGAMVMAGVLAGLLMANFTRDKDRQVSPWPYITGIVAIIAIIVVAMAVNA